MYAFKTLRALFDGRLPRAVFFDLDGTLVDSVPDLAQALNLSYQSLGLEPVSLDLVATWVGNGAQKLVERAAEFAERAELFEDLYQGFLHHYAHLPQESVKTAVYPYVHELLQGLQDQGVKLAVITNKPMRFTPDVLRKNGLSDYFDAVIGGDSLAEKKPSALPLRYMVEHFNVAVDECLMVGDSANDITPANTLGMKSVAVTWGYNHGDSAQDLPASMHIDGYEALLN